MITAVVTTEKKNSAAKISRNNKIVTTAAK